MKRGLELTLITITLNEFIPVGYESIYIALKNERRDVDIDLLYKSGLVVTVSRSAKMEVNTYVENMYRTINMGKVTSTFSVK